MYDTVWASGTCQGCGIYSDAWEIQTKAGERMLDSWTIGSQTTIKTEEVIKDIWCVNCAFAPMPEAERIQNAVQGYPIPERKIGNRWYRDVPNYPVSYVRFELKDGVLLRVEWLKLCPECRGRKSVPPLQALCGACSGRGHTGEVAEHGKPCPDKVRKGPLQDLTDADMKRGIRMLKSFAKKRKRR
jgi:hypothetical protein